MRVIKALFLVLLLAVLMNFAQGQNLVNYADGEGFQTEIVFVNPTDGPVQFLVESYGPDGAPLEIQLKEHGGFYYWFVNLKAGEVWSCATTGESYPFQVGRLNIDALGPGLTVVTIKHLEVVLSERVLR